MRIPSIFRIIAFVVLLGVPFFGGILYYHAKFDGYAPPMQEITSKYQERIAFALHWPFFYKYYLYVPEGYQQNPKASYPLVVLLHGGSRHMYGGRMILDVRVQQVNPTLVLVPIAPRNMLWDRPDSSSSLTTALPLMRAAIDEVSKNYRVDSKRIYVSGYSMGGVGTYAAVRAYPTLFAAAMPLCGVWDARQANLFPKDVPLAIFHGAADRPENDRAMAAALKATGHKVIYQEYAGVGHNVWDYVYTDPRMWNWMLAQRRE